MRIGDAFVWEDDGCVRLLRHRGFEVQNSTEPVNARHSKGRREKDSNYCIRGSARVLVRWRRLQSYLERWLFATGAGGRGRLYLVWRAGMAGVAGSYQIIGRRERRAQQRHQRRAQRLRKRDLGPVTGYEHAKHTTTKWGGRHHRRERKRSAGCPPIASQPLDMDRRQTRSGLALVSGDGGSWESAYRCLRWSSIVQINASLLLHCSD